MLTKFAVKNYRGFYNRIEWDLSNPSNYSFKSEAIRNGVVKNGIIYGDNGSGKTNMGLAIFDIANHLSHKWKKIDYYQNFESASLTQTPVEFEYWFVFNDKEVYYKYSKVSKEEKGIIVEEQLLVNGKELFYKDVDTVRILETFEVQTAAKERLQADNNNISMVNYILSSVPLSKDHALISLCDFVENMLFFRSLDNREFIGLMNERSNIEEYIINNKYTEDFSEYLKVVSGQSFTFAEPLPGEKRLYCIMSGAKIPFLQVASTGTINLELQFFWLKEMASASFVFIDEFDAFYHYELSYEVAKCLFQGNKQVFLTTHDTYLLSNELLRPDCYFILKDNEINPICDLTNKEIRLGHNLEKLYRGGTFDK